MKLRYTANAQRRLRQIIDFNGGGKKAHKIAKDILDRADELEEYPELGPEEDNLKHPQLVVASSLRRTMLVGLAARFS
ncbi:MAG: hypothetical protein R2795_07975 [Saprospiraceae bacterium]